MSRNQEKESKQRSKSSVLESGFGELVIESINRYFRALRESCFSQEEAIFKIQIFKEKVAGAISDFEISINADSTQGQSNQVKTLLGYQEEEREGEEREVRRRVSQISKKQEINPDFLLQVLQEANKRLKNSVNAPEVNNQNARKIQNNVSNSIQEQLSELLKLTKSTHEIINTQQEQLKRQNETIESSIKAQLISQIKPKKASKSITVDLPTTNSISKPNFKSISPNQKVEGEPLTNLSVSITPLKNDSQPRIIGGSKTLLAMKNPKSYLIATSRRGMKVIENQSIIFMKKLPPANNEVLDAIYVKSQDCYFLIIGSLLYRKDINDVMPFVVNDSLAIGSQLGNSLRYSEEHDRLFVVKGGDSIALIIPRTGNLDFELGGNIKKGVTEFRLFGGVDNRVVPVTKENLIQLQSFDVSQRLGSDLSMQRLKCSDFSGLGHDDPYTMVLTPPATESCKRYLLIQLGVRAKKLVVLTRLLIYEIKDTSNLRFLSGYQLDGTTSFVNRLWLQRGIAFWGMSKGRLIFHLHCARDASQDDSSNEIEDFMALVGFNPENQNWVVRKDIRYPVSGFGAVNHLIKNEDSFYFTENGGKIARMRMEGLDRMR